LKSLPMTGRKISHLTFSQSVSISRIRQQIGEGGMDKVWMAEQYQPVRRRLALTLVKSGMDTRQVLARREAERQALSMMDHPNIAKGLDAGTIEAGGWRKGTDGF
jgi:eukaryotic-like serine/threonine-protein kinase